MPTQLRPARIAILAFPEAIASVTYGMYDLFMSAGHDWGYAINGQPGKPLLEPRIVAARSETFTAVNGVRIEPQGTLKEWEDADIVCVPSLAVPAEEALTGRFAEAVSWLKRCHARGATLATACSGAVLLAETGLLNGEEATTHWAYCDAMSTRYPAIKVRKERALVVAGEGQRLVMAGGGTSWQDLAVYLIARTVGVEAAMQVARFKLVDWHAIGQQPFARLASARQVDDAAIARCQVWIAHHYAQAAPVAAMVQQSGLAERSFKRRFQLATGMPPLEYVHTLRLEEAKQMLEAGSLPIEAIANEVGYEDPGFFSRLFRRKVNLTPAQYRRRFGVMRRALEGAVSLP